MVDISSEQMKKLQELHDSGVLSSKELTFFIENRRRIEGLGNTLQSIIAGKENPVTRKKHLVGVVLLGALAPKQNVVGRIGFRQKSVIGTRKIQSRVQASKPIKPVSENYKISELMASSGLTQAQVKTLIIFFGGDPVRLRALLKIIKEKPVFKTLINRLKAKRAGVQEIKQEAKKYGLRFARRK